MGTITLKNLRVGADVTMNASLEDGEVLIDWSTLSNIKAWLYSVDQKSLSGRCDVSVDHSDLTNLICRYSGSKPQYLGVNKLIIQATYMGELKTYDKAAFNFVRWTDGQSGQQITIDDPDVDVAIKVTDVSSSILQNAIAAALQAAEDAEHAAHLIPNQVLLDCEVATAAALNAASKAPYIGANGNWWVWSPTDGEYIDSEQIARGPRGNGITSWSVDESQEDDGENVITVVFTDGEEETFTVKNGKTGNGISSIVQTVESPDDAGTNVITITMTNGTVVTFNVKNGSKGQPGAAQAAYKSVETLPTASAETMDKIYLTPSGTSGVYNMSYTDYDGSAYSWVDMGTTAIQLSDYATKAELTQLEADLYLSGLVDLSTITASNWFINASNKWSTGSGSTRSKMLAITPGTKYKVIPVSENGATFGVLAESSHGTSGSAVSYATGYSARINLTQNETYEFVAPNNAQALYLLTVTSGGVDVEPKVMEWGDFVTDAVETLQAGEKVLQAEVKNAAKEYKLTGADDTWVSEKVVLVPGLQYTVKLADPDVSMTGVTSAYARFAIDAYDSGDTRTDRLVLVNTGNPLSDEYLITIPDTCAYLLIGCRCASGASFRFAIVLGDTRTGISGDELLKGTFNSSFNETDTTTIREAYSSIIEGKDKIETFLLFTDPHLTPESRYETMTDLVRDKYISALQKVYNSLPEDMCICLGDWLNFRHSNAEACAWLGYCDAYMRKLFRNYFPLLGNHDNNPYNPTSTSSSWLNALYYKDCENLMFRENGGTYYSFKGRNTTFYALNSGVSFIKTMTDSTYSRLVDNRWTQVAWLANKLLTDDAEHSVILSHIYANAANEDEWFSTATGYSAKGIHELSANAKALAEAYNARTSITLNGKTYDFTGCTGKVAFYLCGHTHFDYVDTTGKLPIICLTNLEGGVLESGEVSYELIPTFDNCLVDYHNERLYMVRVGAGVSRIINFEPKALSVGGTLSLTTELTGTVTWASRDGDIATVSSGTVSGVATGTVGIIATDENGKQEYWTVVVS